MTSEVTRRHFAPRCVLCGARRGTWRRVSWHLWWSHHGVTRQFRGSLWRR